MLVNLFYICAVLNYGYESMKCVRLILSALCLLSLSVSLPASAKTDGPDFIPLYESYSPVFALTSDRNGYVWTGTTRGLVRYDSHSSKSYLHDRNNPRSLNHNTVNVILPTDSGEEGLWVGTNRGLSFYHPETDDFERVEACRATHVRDLLYCGDSLWVCSSSGLLLLTGMENGLNSCKVDHIIKDKHIACCSMTEDGLWFGSYNTLYRQSPDGGITEIPIPSMNNRQSNLIYAVTSSYDPGKLLLGTEYGLLSYDVGSGKTSVEMPDIPVRCFMHRSNGELWIGTDYGIFIKGAGGGSKYHIVHESGNASSISDNVVSKIHEDVLGNIWVGTDHGVCLTMHSGIYNYHPLRSITHSNDGLVIRTMCRDDEGAVWLGGKNGLIRMNGDDVTWFKADEGDNRISHNKVRHLYADEVGVWVASDGGLDLYEYSSERFRHFDISERTHEYNLSWMYGICEDSRGRLWISTYEGGVVVIDKMRLLNDNGREYCADMHFVAGNSALPSNITSKITFNAGFCFVATDEGLVTINTVTGEILPAGLPESVTAQALCNDGGKVYIGTNVGLYEWNKGKVNAVPGSRLPIWSVAAEGGHVWTASETVASMYDLEDGTVVHCRIGHTPLVSYLIDGDEIYAGTTDGYHVISPDNFSSRRHPFRTRITSLNINNRRIRAGEAVDGKILLEKNIDVTEKVVLPYRSNSFTLEFSDFDFSLSEHRYAYRLKGLNDDWQISENGMNQATFINIPAGTYTFEAGSLTADGKIRDGAASLEIRIRPLWYASPFAYVCYALIVLVLIVAVFMAVHSRRLLTLEREQRGKELKMIKMKSDFMANIAHEFKTPLSIILGHVSKLASGEPEGMHSKELVSLRQNAEKMHVLIDQMVIGNEIESGTIFIPSAASIVDVVQKVYNDFLPAFEEKGISSRLNCDEIQYFFMLDKVKMESALGNLMSNALKFTPQGGSILVNVTVQEETAELIYADISVEDTGLGICEDELPFVFNQYYRAPSNQDDNRKGSGIGLYLVKSIAELHKGTVSVTSVPGKGSKFTIHLSTMKTDSFIIKNELDGEDYTFHTLSKVWNHKRKPIILLVEDNKDIRDFITVSLSDDYTFVCAENGKQGLELLNVNKIDLVITDIMMPVMDGLAMSRKIRRSLVTAFLPIIVLTGKGDRATELESYEFVDAFIPKPFSLKYLNNRIIALLIKHEQYLEKIRQEQMMAADMKEVHNPDEVFMKEITDIINANIDDSEFSAARLVELSRYSSKQVYRKIKQLHGMGTVEFIREVRLKKAALYLMQNKLTVTEVMYMVGFTTPSYFGKCFKNRFGVTPSEYAASNASKIEE